MNTPAPDSQNSLPTNPPAPQEVTPPVTPAPTRLVPPWRFWLPLLLQSTLIVAIPAQAIYTQVTGKTVVLQTAPVDPYDLMRGYSVTLSYDISQTSTLKKLPGWDQLTKTNTTPGAAPQSAPQSSDDLPTNLQFYVVLQAPPPNPTANPTAPTLEACAFEPRSPPRFE